MPTGERIDEMIYVIVFSDGSLGTAGREPNPEHYQAGSRFFRCAEDLTISDINELQFLNWEIPGRLEKQVKQYYSST
jgi:hypothetical protein